MQDSLFALRKGPWEKQHVDIHLKNNFSEVDSSLVTRLAYAVTVCGSVEPVTTAFELETADSCCWVLSF